MRKFDNFCAGFADSQLTFESYDKVVRSFYIAVVVFDVEAFDAVCVVAECFGKRRLLRVREYARDGSGNAIGVIGSMTQTRRKGAP